MLQESCSQGLKRQTLTGRIPVHILSCIISLVSQRVLVVFVIVRRRLSVLLASSIDRRRRFKKKFVW